MLLLNIVVLSFLTHVWVIKASLLTSLGHRFPTWMGYQSVAGEQLEAGGESERKLW